MNNYKKEIIDKICYTELVYGRINKKLKIELEKYIKNKILLYYYKLDTGLSDINTLVVVTEHEE